MCVQAEDFDENKNYTFECFLPSAIYKIWMAILGWLKRWSYVISMFLGVGIIVFLVAVIVVKTVHDNEVLCLTQTEKMVANVALSINSDISMGCVWTHPTKCIIECNGITQNAINEKLTKLWAERPSCETNFDKLELILSGNVLSEGDAQLNHTGSPFKSIAFSFVKTLTISRTTINYVSPLLFDGFLVLSSLNLANVTVYAVNESILNPVANTLETLTMSELSANSSALSLAAFTGRNVNMRRLRKLRVRYNLIDRTITPAMFAGAERLVELNLATCNIEVIAPSTFDSLSFLELINLNNNRIRTIPIGLFDSLLPSYSLYIYMRDNPWSCDCELCYLKTILRTFWWSFPVDKDVCVAPDSLQIAANSSKYCSDETCYEMLVTTAATTERESSSSPSVLQPLSTASPQLPIERVKLLCNPKTPTYVVEMVQINARDRAVRIEDNLDGTVNVTIQMRTDYKTILVWFDNSDKHFQSVLPARRSTNCPTQRSINESQTITLDIRPQVPYTFCVMTNNTQQFVVSPFNCVSYNKRSAADGGHPWFTSEAKTFTVTMLLLGIILIFVFGLIIGYLLLRRYSGCFVRKCTAADAADTPKTPTTTTHNKRSTRRVSEISTISANSYATSADVPPSRFEIVQRQLALSRNRNQRRNQPEYGYYLRSIVDTCQPNIYESSSTSPATAAPPQPTKYTQQPLEAVCAVAAERCGTVRSVGDGDAEPENYYSNAELLFK